MEFGTVFETAQLIVFLVLGGAALRIWIVQRTRPASYLATAFGVLALVVVMGRLIPDSTAGFEFAGDVRVAFLGAFPWLLAAFAWSFEARLPTWLKIAGVLVLGLALWGFLIPPVSTFTASASPVQNLFLPAFMALWAGLSIVAAGRLWRAGGGQRLVRARMRFMSVAAVTLTLTLLLLVIVPEEFDNLAILLSILAAVLFAAGFAPPAPLRFWWRRRTTAQWQQMQVGLIAAATPTDVARVVTPVAAEVVGGGVAVVAADGAVLAQTGLDDRLAAELGEQLAREGSVSGEEEAHRVNNSWLLVQRTPYTPLFGADERDMIAAISLQLRLALERAELFNERAEALRVAEQAHQELEAMLVGLSHDLRSPAVAIVGFASLLRQVDDPDERAQMLDDIETSASYLGRLVDALLELSRVGRTQVDVEPVDLERTVRSVANRLASTYPGLRVEIQRGLPTVLMNHSRAEQLFDNLLANAAKHGGREDLVVTVEAEEAADALRLLVTDNGRGVHPDDRESIFTLFKRARGAATDGNGVGLGFVQRIVALYGGSIRVTDHVGGAQFEILLPTNRLVSESRHSTSSEVGERGSLTETRRGPVPRP